MNVKKLLLSTVVGFIVMFLLGWLGHQVLISGLYETSPMAAIERETPMVLGIAVAYLIIALIMAYMYPKGIEGSSVFGNGLRFGVTVGLLISLPMSLILYSIIPSPFGMVVAEAVWHMIEEGAGGVAIAYVYGMQSEASAATHSEPGGETY